MSAGDQAPQLPPLTEEQLNRAADVAYGMYYPQTNPVLTGKARAWAGPPETNPLRRAVRAAFEAVDRA